MAAAVASPPWVQQEKTSHFRADVQGLRAVAVGSVLLYHAGAPFVPGGYVGVDVFFVISGFLITGLLLRECLTTQRISLRGFYARRARRILPAATLVLLVTAVATIGLLPQTRWENIAGEVTGSAFYYVNWVFAGNATYLNADVPPSPLQHFWTLAVEEQYYIAWPLLLVGLLLLARRRSRRAHGSGRAPISGPQIQRLFKIGALVITVPSLAWSAYYTQIAPGPAYFVTSTRLWELGIGACVAVFAARLGSMPVRARLVSGWVGIVAIGAACVAYSSSTPYPGAAALLPTLGAALVIIGGLGETDRLGVGRHLAARPMRLTGDLSYSLYLWHWPMIVIGTYLLGGELQLWQGLAIVTLSAIPAALSYYFVERGFQNWDRVKRSVHDSLMLGAVMMLVSAMAGMSILLVLNPSSAGVSGSTGAWRAGDGESTGGRDDVSAGAVLLMEDPSVGVAVDQVESFSPAPNAAAQDNPPNYGRGCHQEVGQSEFEPCTFGDADSDDVVALVGDSHAAQWLPALLPVVESQGWRLDVYTKSSCPLVDGVVMLEGRPYDQCAEWNERAMDELTGPDKPDRVIVTSSLYALAPAAGETSLAEGYAGSWRSLLDADVPVTVIIDTPNIGIDVPECVSVNSESLTTCAVPREQAIANSAARSLRAAAESTGVDPVDLTPMICPEETCAPIIGNVLVYRDTNHLTATYSRSLASALEQGLRERGVVPSEQADPAGADADG